MSEKIISTGEAAKLFGLTIRALQHYDNIGILPASGRTEGGRRYYTESDMVKLEHLVFYRGLGFPLEQIKDKLLDESLEDGAGDLLARQKMLLYNQINNLQSGISAIEACQEIEEAGKNPPWMLLATFMQFLGTVDLSVWYSFDFTDEQKQIFTEHLPTTDDALDFYMVWKRLSIKAAAFNEAGIAPDESIAQKLAADWKAMTEKVTGGNVAHQSAYLEVDQKRASWNPSERELIEKAEPFLQKAIEIYNSK